MNLLLYGVVAIVILGLLTGIGYKVRESGKDAIRVEWAEANRQQREAEAKQADKAAVKLETGNQKAKVIYRTITEKVNVEVEKPVYRNICLEPDGVRLVNAAVRGEIPAAPESDKPLPKPAGAGGRDGGNSSSVGDTGR